MKTIRMIVKGKVQGVYFRASAKKTADQLNISGWIRNLPDRNVEILASSSDEELEKLHVEFKKLHEHYATELARRKKGQS